MTALLKYFMIYLLFNSSLIWANAMKVSDVEAKYSSKPQVVANEDLQQSINIGFSSTSGNTETLNFTGKYNVSFMSNGYKAQKLKTAFETSLYMTKNNNVKNHEEYTAILALEQSITNNWLGYSSFNWFKNRFLNYESKSSLSLGLGKELSQDKQHSLKFKIGMGYNIENFVNNQQTKSFSSFNEYLEYKNQLNQVSSFYFKIGSMQRFDSFSNGQESSQAP